jgi:hypothetical protein
VKWSVIRCNIEYSGAFLRYAAKKLGLPGCSAPLHKQNRIADLRHIPLRKGTQGGEYCPGAKFRLAQLMPDAFFKESPLRFFETLNCCSQPRLTLFTQIG